MLDLTLSEKRVLIIILAVVVIATGIQLFNTSSINQPILDYTESDSIFSRLSHVKPPGYQNNLIRQNSHTQDSIRIILPLASGQAGHNVLININKATEQELTQLPRIGPAIAKRIITYREANGFFKSNDDLKKVKGIGPKTFEKIEPHLQKIE